MKYAVVETDQKSGIVYKVVPFVAREDALSWALEQARRDAQYTRRSQRYVQDLKEFGRYSFDGILTSVVPIGDI